jgi:S-(hydroxymethyl)glutathione dehydrogenase/alcohol dehydrogenase
MAEQVVVPADAVIRIPSEVPLDDAALLGCAVLTGVGAATRAAGVRSGDSVLVVGLGGVGLSAVMGARLAGARQVIAVDTSASKESLARAAGATDFLVAGDRLYKRVRALTGGRGADRALECVGSAATIRSAWSSVRRGGTCVVVGVGRQDDQVSFSPLELFHFSRTLTSSVYGNSDPERDVPMLIEHMTAGRLDPTALVTHRISLADVPTAFERMQRGEGGRSVVVMRT